MKFDYDVVGIVRFSKCGLTVSYSGVVRSHELYTVRVYGEDMVSARYIVETTDGKTHSLCPLWASIVSDNPLDMVARIL